MTTATGPRILEQDDSQTGGDAPSRADRLTKARAAAAAKRAQGEKLYRDPIQRARAKPTSLRLAIAAKCYECTGSGADAGWRETIRSCSVDCPLRELRPYQRTDGEP